MAATYCNPELLGNLFKGHCIIPQEYYFLVLGHDDIPIVIIDPSIIRHFFKVYKRKLAVSPGRYIFREPIYNSPLASSVVTKDKSDFYFGGY